MVMVMVMVMVMLTSKVAMAKHIEFLYGMEQITKFKEPPSSICISCGKSNTNKDEVEKNIMCHTREKTQLGLGCEKAFTQFH